MDNYCYKCGRYDRHKWGSACARPYINPSPTEEEMDAELVADISTPKWKDTPIWVLPYRGTPTNYIGLRVRLASRDGEVVGRLTEAKPFIKHVSRGGYRVGGNWYDSIEWQLMEVETPPVGWWVQGKLLDGGEFRGLTYENGAVRGLAIYPSARIEHTCDFRELEDARWIK